MQKPCVVAIDIGETHSRMQFSFKDEPNFVESLSSWKGSAFTATDVPTAALFNEKKEFHSFGFEAENQYSNLTNDEQKRWFYFQRFGIISSDSMTKTTLSDVKGKTMDSYLVYGSAIKFFKKALLKSLRQRVVDVKESEFHFCIIVPSVFKASLKTVLQKAFLSAGIKVGDYSFVRESEAVISYWKNVLTNKSIHPELADGKCFLIVSLRGRTASVTAQTTSSGTLNRLHYVSGGGWGGQAVNENFKQLLIKIVGAPVFLQFLEKNDTFYDIESEIKTKLRTMHPTFEGKVTLGHLTSLFEIYEKCFNETVEDAVSASPFAGKITILRDKIRLNASVFKGLFKNVIEEIISNINNTLMSDAVKDVKTEVIFLVGDFSESPLVQDAVKKAFPNYQVICPEDPTITVGIGAVLKGHHTEIRCSVISNFSYGVHFRQVNNEGGLSVVQRSETKILVRKGDKVYKGDYVTWKFHVEICDDEHIELQFFVSPRVEAVTLGEEDVVYTDMVNIEVDGTNKKDIDTSIVYGDFGFFGRISGRYVGFNEFK